MIPFFNDLRKDTELFDCNIAYKECIVKPLCSKPCTSWENCINVWPEERYNKCLKYVKERIRNEKRSL